MANHCYNYAVFTGIGEDQNGLKQLIGSLKKTAENFKEEVRDLPDDNVWIYGLNGHILLGTKPPKRDAEGNYANDPYKDYGSKWFDCHFEVQEADGFIDHVVLQGDSAWSPMLPLFEKICKRMNLKCYGNYEESGMDFAGEFEMTPEGISEHNQMSYREYQAVNNPDSYWEDLLMWIEEGHFDVIDDVFVELGSVGWTANEEERKELQEAFARYSASKDESQ